MQYNLAMLENQISLLARSENGCNTLKCSGAGQESAVAVSKYVLVLLAEVDALVSVS